MHKTEEKGSDLNLATWLPTDAFEHDCQVSVLVTNDSDLALPIEVLTARLGHPVGLVSPYPRVSRSLLSRRPAFLRTIRPGLLAASQLPREVVTGARVLHRPITW